MERDSAVIYRSFYEAVKALPEKLQKDAVMNLLAYAFDGVEPEKPDALFILMKPQVDANNKKFENGCKGSDYGKRGGRPKKNPIGVSESNENETCENPIGVSENIKTETPKKPQNAETETPTKPPMRNEKCEMRNDKENRESAQPLREFDSLISGTGLSDQAKAAVRDWVSYKQNKGSPYVQQSFIAFLNRTAQAIAQYGEGRVLWCIGESLSNGWNNIRWEKLDDPVVSAKDAKAGHSQERHTDYNAMVMQELAECMG